MKQQFNTLAISGLRWTLGLVVLLESLRFTFSVVAAQHFAKTGFPPWIRPALGGGEIIAALLFLAPASKLIGGYALLSIFAIAAVIHLLHGEFDMGFLVVYAMAATVCITHRDAETVKVANDR